MKYIEVPVLTRRAFVNTIGVALAAVAAANPLVAEDGEPLPNIVIFWSMTWG